MSLFFVQDHSFLDINFTLNSKGNRLVGMCLCTLPSIVETFSGKISTSIGSSKEIAGLNKKKNIMMMMTRNS